MTTTGTICQVRASYTTRPRSRPIRFFFTDDVPDLESELRRAGHEVVGSSADRVTAICTGSKWRPGDYDPRPFIRHHRPDVCVFVAPLRIIAVDGGWVEFGYHRNHLVDIKGIRECVTVGLARIGDDPAMSRMYRDGKCPKCVVGPQSLHMWATADEATAAEVARERRCALWRPGEGGAGGLVAAVDDIKARRRYGGGKDARAYGV